MLKKTAAFILKIISAVSLLLASPAASAWDEVCVNFTGGIIDEGRFYVVHGFPVDDDWEFPVSYYDDNGGLRLLPAWIHPEGYGRPSGVTQPAAAGRIRSSYGPAGSTKCVSIRELDSGEPFFVYVEYLAAEGAEGDEQEFFWHGRCSTHASNPNWWYHQQERPYRKMMYKAAATTEAECNYWRETN